MGRPKTFAARMTVARRRPVSGVLVLLHQLMESGDIRQ